MGKKHLLSVCVGLIAMTSVPTAMTAATKVNLAANVSSLSASVYSDDNPVSKVNDGNRELFWSAWHGAEYYGQEEYVELAWDVNVQAIQCKVYWAESGDSILLPSDAYLSRWDGHQWNKAATLNAAENGVSTTTVDITTNRIRLYMKSDKACGVREIRLIGYMGEACTKATLYDASSTRAYVEGVPIVLSPTLTLPDGETEDPIWNWTLPDGTTATTASVTATQPGIYQVSYQRQCGATTYLSYNVYDPSVSYSWPDYKPTLFYDYRSEYPSLDPPTKFLPENNNQGSRVKADGWWAIAWGPKCSGYVTDTAKDGILKKMNEDFAYFRDEMGWPPDKRARNGYYSTIYVYGSGLYTDGEDSTALGGWQSATSYNGSSWPMVYLSYYPIACFDPKFTYDKYQKRSVTDQTAQQNACVHEGIHAIFADLEGCKNSAWYQEAGNTWLQGEAELKKTGVTPTSMGWLSAGNMIAPFMPIECYSGWLLDGSFGGPSAEGVNMYNSSGQVCTWRKLLGGVQYGELFPHFVSEILGQGSIPWIWRYCKSRVLEGMADSLGDTQMRRLILEYRSRQCLIDVGQWSRACRKLLDDNWLVSLEQEWSPYWIKVDPWKATPYVNMYKETNEVDSAGWWYPEARTTPGWSGANQVPLHVNGEVGNIISIHFKPKAKNMVCQLCYRSKRGRCFYSQPVEGEGDVVMKLTEQPANNVVFAVICNTDYIYTGETQRKSHYDYRLKMQDNVYAPASSQLKWYNYNSTITDKEFEAGINEVTVDESEAVTFSVAAEKAVVSAGETVALHITGASQYQIPVRMIAMSGEPVYQESLLRNGDYHIPSDVAPGMYILQAYNAGESASTKIIVK